MTLRTLLVVAAMVLVFWLTLVAMSFGQATMQDRIDEPVRIEDLPLDEVGEP